MAKGTFRQADILFSNVAAETQDIEEAYGKVRRRYGKKLADAVYENAVHYNEHVERKSTVFTGKF